MGKFDLLYACLPVSMQHLAVSLYGLYWQNLRFGGNFKGIENEYHVREWYDATQWNQFLDGKLKEILYSAALFVPYYSNCWTESQKRAAERGDLQSLPILDKEEVRKDPKAL